MSTNPLDGEPLMVAAAKASVGPQLLPDLVEHVQSKLGPRLGEYRREYERVYRDDDREAFLVETDHWTDLGAEFELEPRECEAVRRAHAEQLRHLGRRDGRETEFRHALEVREVVVVGHETADTVREDRS